MKVDTFIKVIMEMDLAEARELRDALSQTPGELAEKHYEALEEALSLAKGMVKGD